MTEYCTILELHTALVNVLEDTLLYDGVRPGREATAADLERVLTAIEACINTELHFVDYPAAEVQ